MALTTILAGEKGALTTVLARKMASLDGPRDLDFRTSLGRPLKAEVPGGWSASPPLSAWPSRPVGRPALHLAFGHYFPLGKQLRASSHCRTDNRIFSRVLLETCSSEGFGPRGPVFRNPRQKPIPPMSSMPSKEDVGPNSDRLNKPVVGAFSAPRAPE